MRQRTTILLPSGQGVDPKAIHLRGSALNVSLTDSVIEERATWSLDEIPPEVLSCSWYLAIMLIFALTAHLSATRRS